MKRAEKKDYLVEIAGAMFDRYGYNGVGIDRIIAESGIAKTTLYRHFKTKDELIVAVLAKKDEAFREAMRDYAEARSDKPAEQLLATFDFLEEWFHDEDFYGCPFMSASSEFNDPDHPVFQEARTHKQLVVDFFEELARAAGLPDPAFAAAEVNLLHEGATAVAHVMRDPSAARTAKAAAACLLV